MKKKLTILSMLLGLSYFALTSYREGPAAYGGMNRTGSDGGIATCGGGGCHSNNLSSTTGQLQVVDATTGLPVTQYQPGVQYIVSLSGSNSTGASLPAFGFQASATLSGGGQAGSFSVIAPNPGVQISTLGSLQIAEHTNAIGDTTPNHYIVRFGWTAPAKGSGTVTFYSILNAVNNNGNQTGDAPNALPNLVLSEKPTGVPTVASKFNTTLYPNPFNDILHINLDAAPGTYYADIYNATGQKQASKQININGNSGAVAINTITWPNGIYILQIAKDDNTQAYTIIKQ